VPTSATNKQAESLNPLVARLIAIAKADDELMERLAEAVESGDRDRVFEWATRLVTQNRQPLAAPQRPEQ
jgi:hypothetical protein